MTDDTTHGAVTSGPDLTTFAPPIDEPPRFLPTGNLWVSLAEVDMDDGAVRSLGALVERTLGLVEARGATAGDRLVQPLLVFDGQPVPLVGLTWERHGHWLPHFSLRCPVGTLDGWYCAPVGERGVALRLRFTGSGPTGTVELGWTGCWDQTTLTHLRAKPVGGEAQGRDDAWTGSRTVSLTTGLPLLAIAWQAGDALDLSPGGDGPRWRSVRRDTAGEGTTIDADLYLGVATEPDGAATTALHLRRRGFDALWDSTLAWLGHHALPVIEARPGLAARVNSNLFFNHFFAQGDCLDTGRPVLVTSRSPRYYVSAAFWSRDAYCWTFPALLLTDPARARTVLCASLAAAGPRVADHALYLNGTSLYPGFELDQAAAPVLAVARYVRATGDRSVLDETPVRAALDGLLAMVGPWRHPRWELYATFLLPTDDPTAFPYVTTANALLAAAFDALAELAGLDRDLRGWGGEGPDDLRRRAGAIRSALDAHLVVEGADGPVWAWACDVDGVVERRDEPPLSLRTLPYWGVGTFDGPRQRATRAWLGAANPHHYAGRFAGAGAPHFPFPSGFDLANRLLDGDTGDGDPLDQLVGAPMDQGLACESWDVDSGRVRTGAAMASMGGLLAWTAWEHLQGRQRWDGPSAPAGPDR